ncbi:hypothetical protein D3C80_1655800 [compost metagenome]
MSTAELIRPPFVHVNWSLPTLVRISPLITPPETVMLSSPPLVLMLPPMEPPDTIMVSLSNPVTRLPSIVPPDMSKILVYSFMSTRPILPAVIFAISPSTNESTILPPVIRKVSRPPPCARD